MKKILLTVLIVLGVLTLSACATRRNQAPEILGANLTPEIHLGDTYDPLDGVTATDPEDGDITADIEVSGLDGATDAVGTATIILTVTDSEGLEAESVVITLTVLAAIVQEPTLAGVVTNPEITENDLYNPLSGVTATDVQDGNLTSSVVTVGYNTTMLETPGTHTFTVSVTDSDSNTTSITVTLTVVARSAFIPTISLINRNPEITVGDPFNPLTGATASDPQDGDLTNSIVVSGYDPDDITIPGTYTITLEVTDADSNSVSTTITLTVLAVIAPPVITGVVENQTYYIGSGTYNPLAGVTATDSTDGNITDSIVVSGTYLLDTPGIYTITLRVTNSNQIRTSVTIRLTVAQSEIPFTLGTDPIEITFWHANGEEIQALMQKYADSFQLLYPNVTVIIPAGVSNYDVLKTNMINAITAQDVPNLVQGYPDHVAEYLNGKAVLNLNPYIYSEQWGLNGDDALADIKTSYLEENSQYDATGTFYSLPFNKSTEVMIYNKTAFTALGLDEPETWQDVIAAGPQLKGYGDAIAEAKVRAANPGMSEANLAPLIAAAKLLVVPASYDSTGNGFITFTRQFNGAYTGIDYSTYSGQYLWNNNVNTTAAMQFLKDHNDIITLPEYWDQQFASTPFLNQQTFVTIGSSAGIRYNIPPTDPTTHLPVFELGVGPVPYNGDLPDYKAVIQQGTNVSLMKTGTAQEQLASWLFLKHLINSENTTDFATHSGYLPVRTSAYLSTTYQEFLTNPTANQLPISMAANAAFLQSGYMFYDPAFIGSSRARLQVGLALERIMLGDGDIAAALLEAYTEANLGGS